MTQFQILTRGKILTSREVSSTFEKPGRLEMKQVCKRLLTYEIFLKIKNANDKVIIELITQLSKQINIRLYLTYSYFPPDIQLYISTLSMHRCCHPVQSVLFQRLKYATS